VIFLFYFIPEFLNVSKTDAVDYNAQIQYKVFSLSPRANFSGQRN